MVCAQMSGSNTWRASQHLTFKHFETFPDFEALILSLLSLCSNFIHVGGKDWSYSGSKSQISAIVKFTNHARDAMNSSTTGVQLD